MFRRHGRSSRKAAVTQSHSLIQFIFLLVGATDKFVEDHTNSIDGIIETLVAIRSFEGLNAAVVGKLRAGGSDTGSQSDSEIK